MRTSNMAVFCDDGYAIAIDSKKLFGISSQRTLQTGSGGTGGGGPILDSNTQLKADYVLLNSSTKDQQSNNTSTDVPMDVRIS